jgi:hypothetical protein
MNDLRENYFIAREIVAKELKQRYDLVESYKDDNRITLNSTNHSIHLTFYVPDGLDFSISKKGEPALSKDSYFGHISNNKTLAEIDEVLNKNASKFEPLPKAFDEYETKVILRYFHICISFFETEYPQYFD